MKNYFLAIDEGTTGTRAIIYDLQFKVVSYAYTEITQYTPASGMVEQDFEEIYEKTVAMCKEAMVKAGITAEDVISIGITNQRNTQCLWDKKTGKPIIRGIVWQDTRTAKLLEEERKKPYIKENETKRCGREFCTSSSPVLLKWVMENHPDAAEKMEKGEAAFGCVETWLIWCLTGGKTHAITYSNASSLQLYDFTTDDWCWPVIDGAGIPHSILPNLMEEISDFGTTTVFGAPIPITASAGDQHCSMFAQNCRKPGTAKCTNGTGTFMDVNIGDKYFEPRAGMVTMVAWSIGGKKTYLFEGMLTIAGSVIQWLRDGLDIIKDPTESQTLAESVPDTDGVIFVTTMAGSFVPVYDAFARGTIFGIHKGTTKAHIARAALEGIAFGISDILALISEQIGINLSELRIDGGTSRNNVLAQALADFNQCKVFRAGNGSAATGAGAAQMASIGAGIYTLENIPSIEAEDDIFSPVMSVEKADEKLAKYREAVKRSAGWAK